jgi:hypothetical protein
VVRVPETVDGPVSLSTGEGLPARLVRPDGQRGPGMIVVHDASGPIPFYASSDSFDDDIQSRPELIGARGEDTALVECEILPLLFRRSRTEVKGAVEPDGRKQSYVRSSVTPYGRKPEHLRPGEDSHHLRPRPGNRVRVAEPGISPVGYPTSESP